MKREIKFRGLRADNNRWEYGDIHQNSDDGKVYMAGNSTETMGGISYTLWDVIPESVGQFTGLKDKNGNEIYEGDILKIPDDWDNFGFMAGEVRSIYFFDGCFRFKPKDETKQRGHTLEYVSNEFEIIGNIHEPKH